MYMLDSPTQNIIFAASCEAVVGGGLRVVLGGGRSDGG